MQLLRSLLLFFWLGLGIHPHTTAQKVYQLAGRKEAPVIGLSLATGLGGWSIGRHVSPLTPADLALLDRNRLIPIDRKSTYWSSSSAKKASNLAFYSATLAPLLLLAEKETRKDAAVISVLYLETLTLNSGLTELTKNLAKRSRPYTYNPDYPLAPKLGRDARKSFFSGHTSSTAASCFFAAKVWSDYHPGNRWKPLVWATAATIPALTGYFRMRAGQHFFTDVAVGYSIGATIGYLIPVLHRKASF